MTLQFTEGLVMPEQSFGFDYWISAAVAILVVSIAGRGGFGSRSPLHALRFQQPLPSTQKLLARFSPSQLKC
jgi:hypothetical protein